VNVSPTTFAKVIGVLTDDGRRALVVLDADGHLDLPKARGVLGATHVRLMTEAELAESCPGCDVGATPAVGATPGRIRACAAGAVVTGAYSGTVTEEW